MILMDLFLMGSKLHSLLINDLVMDQITKTISEGSSRSKMLRYAPEYSEILFIISDTYFVTNLAYLFTYPCSVILPMIRQAPDAPDAVFSATILGLVAT